MIYFEGNILDEEALKKLEEIHKYLLDNQVELTPDDSKVLRENLWDLYI